MVLPSRKTVEGTSRAPNRAMYKAMGLTDKDLSRPIVAVSSTCNEVYTMQYPFGKISSKS